MCPQKPSSRKTVTELSNKSAQKLEEKSFKFSSEVHETQTDIMELIG